MTDARNHLVVIQSALQAGFDVTEMDCNSMTPLQLFLSTLSDVMAKSAPQVRAIIRLMLSRGCEREPIINVPVLDGSALQEAFDELNSS